MKRLAALVLLAASTASAAPGAASGDEQSLLAAVDATTGTVLDWKAATSGVINALALSGNTLYVAGFFDTIASQPRNSLAALDATTGAVRDWNPNPIGFPDTRIYALALRGHTLYVGGDYYYIAGQYWTGLAAVNDSSGKTTNAAKVDEIVWSLAVDGSMLFVGGYFGSVDRLPIHSLAAVSLPELVPTTPISLALAQSAPNPARTTAIIHFALPAASPVTLGVYDVQGRRIALLLDHQIQRAGEHDVLVQADRWKPGVYFYRLEAAGRTATRKMIVVQ